MKILLNKKLIALLFIILFVSTFNTIISYQSGAPAGYTNAPSEGNCTSCHSGSAINSGTNWNAINITGLPTNYTPGQTYALTLNASTAGTSRNGFQLTVLNGSNQMAGSLTASTGSAITTNAGRTYVNHSSTGNSWNFSWTAPNPAQGTLTFYLSLNATNANNNNSGDIVYVKSFTSSVGNLPTAVITPSSTTICLGDTLYLQGSGANNPTGFTWEFLGNNPSGSILQNPYLVYTTTGFKTVRLTTSNSNGNSTQAQVIINVVAKPSATISASSLTICGNDSITLSANSGNGFSYLWSPGSATTQSIKVGSAGNYSVKVSNSSGCFANSASTAVTKINKPLINLTTAQDTVCVNDSIMFTASTGFNQYTFLFNAQSSITNTNTLNIKLNTGNQMVKVVGFNGTCNSDTVNKMVFVPELQEGPTISCINTTSSSITFSITGNNPKISLDNGVNYISPNNGNNHIINGLNPNQSVTVKAYNQNNSVCGTTAVTTKTCVASACQPITYGLTFNKTACLKSQNDSVLESIILNNLSVINFGYKLNNGALTNSNSQNTFIKNGLNPITISIIDSNNIGCGFKDSIINISGINSPQNKPVLIAQNTICKNGLINLESTTSTGAHLFAYQKVGDSFPFKVSGNTFSELVLNTSLKHGDSVYVTAIDTNNGCSKVSEIIVLNIVEPQKAGFTATINGLTVTYTDTTQSIARSWSFGDGTFGSSKTENKTYLLSGNYNVKLTITDINNCINVDSTSINVSPTGLPLFKNNQFKIYPNPTTGILFIEPNFNDNFTIEVLSLDGKMIYTKNGNDLLKLDLNLLMDGVYYLKINLDNHQLIKRIIKSH